MTQDAETTATAPGNGPVAGPATGLSAEQQAEIAETRGRHITDTPADRTGAGSADVHGASGARPRVRSSRRLYG